MIEIRRILCPIDYSDFSRRALDHAVAIARWYGSTVALLHVSAPVPALPFVSGTGAMAGPVFVPEDHNAVEAALREFAGEEGAAAVPLQFEVRDGNTAEEILQRAESWPADLLVMGTHGRSGFQRLVLGSITEKVVRRAACPVLTVPGSARDAVPASPVVFERIVCAIDFSDYSMHGLEYATSLAQETDATLVVVHVMELPPDLPREVQSEVVAGGRTFTDLVALTEQERRAQLERAVPASVREFCSVETVLATGKPYQEILRVADERDADLLVVGIHGRGAVDRMLFGSTTQHLVRQAACPVLTLRHG